jgi:hypothetical protein
VSSKSLNQHFELKIKEKMKKFFYYILFVSIILVPRLSKAQEFISDTTFVAPNVDTVNSFSVDYKTSPGFLKLETGEKENLAKGHFAYVVYAGASPVDTARANGRNLVDGKYSTPSYIEIPPLNKGGLAGTYIIIDLEAVRKIKKIQMYSVGGSPNTRVRAYTILVGMDTNSINMEKVFQDADNQVSNPIATFPPTDARYIKIIVDVLAQTASCALAEVEVYGEGYLPQGVYYSNVKKITKPVNFGSFQFIGNKPLGTNLYFSFRTGNTQNVDSTWSKWSDSTDMNNSLFEVFEPRQYIQYRIRLTTDVLNTPVVDEIRINYDTSNVCSGTNASILPQYAQILKEQNFTISINAQFNNNDLGIDTLFMLTPSPIKLQDVKVNNLTTAYQSKVTANNLKIIFNSSIKSSSQIDINFIATPFLGVSPFKIYASSKLLLNNPQRIDSKSKDGVEAWSIITLGVPDKLIIRGEAIPNPFTPNGDGKNDVTEILFYLGNIAQPVDLIGKEYRKLTIKIFDLNGRTIRSLFDKPTRAYAYVADNAIVWDGKDDSGNLVRPGVYIFQIFVDSDNGGEYLTKTVVVSY